MRPNTTRNFLTTALECENKAADTFMALSEMFGHVADVSALCLAMYEDEKKHIALLECIKTEMPEEGSLLPVERNAWEFVKASSLFMEKDLIGGIATFGDLHEVAHELENHEIMLVFRLFSLKTVPLAARRSIIENQIDRHMQKLDELDRMYSRHIGAGIKARRKEA